MLPYTEGIPVADAVVDLGFATREEVEELLLPERMTTNKKFGGAVPLNSSWPIACNRLVSTIEPIK